MTNLTLTTFVPGTKAKADEVNANFSALKDALNEKACETGDSATNFSVADATDDKHAVNKSQLDTLSTLLGTQIKQLESRFCALSGNTTNGEADLFSFSSLAITAKIGGSYKNLVFADYLGNQTEISSAETLSMTGKADGTYNIFVNSQGELYALKNVIYRQKKRPAMTEGDIWLDTSKEPLVCIKYNGSSDDLFADVPIGRVVLASGAITSLTTLPYNQNGYDMNANSVSKYKYNYANKISKTVNTLFTAEDDGLLYWYFPNNANATAKILLDGVEYIVHYTTQGQTFGFFFHIAKGQTYKVYGARDNGTLSYIPKVKV